MTLDAPCLKEIADALKPHGILLRGVINLGSGQGPKLNQGGYAASVVLLGNVGGSIWPSFSRWRQDYLGHHPLDTWSRECIEPVAATVGATAVFPWDRPYQPFQRWAMQAEGLKPSPLGILIHPSYGLWHGYRGALAFAQEFDPIPVERRPHPCRLCAEKPCLTACPAHAVMPTVFSVEGCHKYLQTEAARPGCMTHGCAARNACPIGAAYRYPSEQIVFHMAALA